jgi:hypothetical protein
MAAKTLPIADIFIQDQENAVLSLARSAPMAGAGYGDNIYMYVFPKTGM